MVLLLFVDRLLLIFCSEVEIIWMLIRVINIFMYMLVKVKIFFVVGIDRFCGVDSV